MHNGTRHFIDKIYYICLFGWNEIISRITQFDLKQNKKKKAMKQQTKQTGLFHLIQSTHWPLAILPERY